MKKPTPYKWPLRFFRWYCHPDYLEDLEGDLLERFERKVETKNITSAKIQFLKDVIKLFRPGIIKSFSNDSSLNHYDMFKNYFKVSWRNLSKNKVFSLINIGGLSVGMAVTVIIAMWVHDELTFNQNHKNYDRIARVIQHRTIGAQKETWFSTQTVLSEELRNKYSDEFEKVVKSTFPMEKVLTYKSSGLTKTGLYMEAEGPDIFSLKMVHGSAKSLSEPNAIILSESFSQILFKKENPIGKVLELNDGSQAQVSGIYEDIPSSSSLNGTDFIGSWELFLSANEWIRNLNNPWGLNGFQTFVLLSENSTFSGAEIKIKNVILENIGHDPSALSNKPETALFPMSHWHLFWKFENGINIGGSIQTVWLIGSIGVFVLLIACINFMNLSTARSEKRAKEVGVRKAIGSARKQLVQQFFTESILISFSAFILSLIMVILSLKYFNQLADKSMVIPWSNPLFWLLCFSFMIFTGLLSGSYPALYLSSFNVLKSLKNSRKAGSLGYTPRKLLIVTQFTISIVLIIGTITVYNQIQHAKDRPVGYNQDHLISFLIDQESVSKSFELIRNELIKKSVVSEMAKSDATLTSVWRTIGSIEWAGKDPTLGVDFPISAVTHEYGETVGWNFIEGRNFSRDFSTDTAAFIINQAAVRFMGLRNPVGSVIKWDNQPYEIIGVIEDMLIESPYAPIRPFIYQLGNEGSVITLKLNPGWSAQAAITHINEVVTKHIPEAVIDVNFIDESYARKFNSERRIGTLSSIFAALAIMISCLGLFGLASYMAEQRKKEISIRKVLGASVAKLWQTLSKDFIVLIIISCLIAIPVSYYFLDNWLQQFNYRTDVSWVTLLTACLSALLITLITISHQAIKTALVNPTETLKSE